MALAFDFEWLNRQLFFNSYKRVRSYFGKREFQAEGRPQAEELIFLEKYKNLLPAEIWQEAVPEPTRHQDQLDSSQTLRDHLRQAKALLAQAGWHYKDGALRNAQGQAMVLEFIDGSSSGTRVVAAFQRNLAKLGISVKHLVFDPVVFKNRVDQFNFDVVSQRIAGLNVPGIELLERFSSKSANDTGSNNIIGLESEVVDRILEEVLMAKSYQELATALRVLDRVLRFGFYTIPHWYAADFRIAYRQEKLQQPDVLPKIYQPESWVLSCWWSRQIGK